MVIVQEGLGLERPLIFDIMLHVGTVCVVIAVFWKDIAKIVRSMVKLDFKTEEGKLALFIAVGSAPTALIGLVFHDVVEALFHNVLAVGIAMLITGVFLRISNLQKTNRKLSFLDSLLVGLAQGAAIIPGISRSGLTIATGLLRRVERETIFRYSFLLSAPAIIGATIVESRDLIINNADLVATFYGVVTSFMVGYVSLRALHKIVLRGRFHLFAYYCWIVGTAIVFFCLLH